MTPEGRACWAVADTHFQALEKIFKKMSKDDLQDEEVKKQKGEIDKHATVGRLLAAATLPLCRTWELRDRPAVAGHFRHR